ncbi:hypothetical protein PTKIN_Ptkin01aG0313900 [Pterospermum kingtungense]
MTSLSFFVGVIGNIISVLLFLSPANTFRRIVKNRSTEEFESLPYICTLLNSALWTYYGVTKPGSYLVATVNGFGVVVEMIYVTLFLIFAPPRIKAKTWILFGLLDVGFVAAAVLVTRLVLHGDLRIDVIGFLCAGLNIIMYGSPLAALKTVATTKSVEYMPFLLSFFVFLNGAIWTFYAVLVEDYFLGVPNGIGFLLGTAQLLLYGIYSRKHKSSKTSSNDHVDNEYQIREGLISSSGNIINEKNQTFASETISIEKEKPTAYDLLKGFNFPVGLLPKGVVDYDLDSSSGKFSAFLNGSCSFSLEGSYQLKYKDTIKGYISKGKIASLEGVSVKLFFMWVNIVEISRRGDDLEFSVGIAGADFPIDNFEECPQCGCGLDCSDQQVGKIRKNPYVSSY